VVDRKKPQRAHEQIHCHSSRFIGSCRDACKGGMSCGAKNVIATNDAEILRHNRALLGQPGQQPVRDRIIKGNRR
jgi:hypothetical protein